MEEYIEELLRNKELSEDVGELLDDYAQILLEVEQWRTPASQQGHRAN